MVNIRQDPFERTPSINSENLNNLGGGYMNDFYAREFWRFVLVQQKVAELAKTAIDYACPVGGRWVVAFWSPRVLGHNFTQQARSLLYMAASAAAMRLKRLVGADAQRVGSRACLTPRVPSVLRYTSTGSTLEETAKVRGLGEETICTHFKKAQAKLGTRNRTHTVAEAMRHLLII